jgi:hypothetical protein
MFSKTSLAVLTLGIGMVLGGALTHITVSPSAYAQEPGQLLIQGHGRAISSLQPPGEQFTLSPSNDLQRSFKIVPAGKKFVLTDVMYNSQGSVRQDLTVNIASANPANTTHTILFQSKISPGESDDIHLCSGYVIPSGHALVAFTNAGLLPEQYVTVSVTGHLVDE